MTRPSSTPRFPGFCIENSRTATGTFRFVLQDFSGTSEVLLRTPSNVLTTEGNT